MLTKYQWVWCISPGFFLFVVLYLYEGFGIPSGISPTGYGLLFRAASFGLLSFLLLFLNEAFLKPRLKADGLLRRMLWYLWELLLIWNAIFLLINLYWNWNNLGWFAYFDLLGELASVLIFPIILTELFRRTDRSEKPVDVSYQKLVFKADNGKDQISLSPDDFLYITSEDNYIDIFFRQDGDVNHKTLRSSLKRVDEALGDSPWVVRCHRSYIINPFQVIQLSSTSRGNKVVMPHTIKLPVSDSYMSDLKEKLPV